LSPTGIGGSPPISQSLLRASSVTTFEPPQLSILAKDVSEERVANFLSDYLKGRREFGATEQIFRHFVAYEQRQEHRDSAGFGFNVVLRKEPFGEGAHWAPLTGWEFAVAEERHLAAKLEGMLKTCTEGSGQMSDGQAVPLEVSATLDAGDRLARSLVESGYDPGVIVLASSLSTDDMLNLAKRMEVPDWDLDSSLQANWIIGEYHGRLLMYLRYAESPAIYAIDVARFARLIQFSPEAELLLEDVPISMAVEKGILDHQNRVHMNLYQSYEFELVDCEAVRGTPVDVTPSA